MPSVSDALRTELRLLQRDQNVMNNSLEMKAEFIDMSDESAGLYERNKKLNRSLYQST